MYIINNRESYRQKLKEFRDNSAFNNDKHKVYGMFDPRDDTLFYIGCTKVPMHTRFCQHLCAYYTRRGILKTERVKCILKDNQFPYIKIFYTFEDKLKARIAEKFITNFVARHVKDGKIHLLNSINIGECISEEINMIK